MDNNFDENGKVNSDLIIAQDYVNKKINFLKQQASVLMEEINDCEIKLKETTNILETYISKKDINISLFSPCKDNSEYNEKLKDEIENINTKIPLLFARKEEILKELNNLNNIEKILANVSDKANNLDSNDSIKKKEYDQVGKCIIEAQELERNRIARDLHDSSVQVLTSLIHKSELCTKLIDTDLIRTKLELVTMIGVIHNVINDMRTIIYDLRPMSLNDLGLVTTIERLLDDVQYRSHIQTSFQVINEEICLPYVVGITLYRVVQEACNNTIKHANANAIKVELTFLENEINLIISDDGVGFDVNSKIGDCNNKCVNFGLSIIKERISLLFGKINIESQVNQGTKIYVNVPNSFYEGDKIG